MIDPEPIDPLFGDDIEPVPDPPEYREVVYRVMRCFGVSHPTAERMVDDDGRALATAKCRWINLYGTVGGR